MVGARLPVAGGAARPSSAEEPPNSRRKPGYDARFFSSVDGSIDLPSKPMEKYRLPGLHLDDRSFNIALNEKDSIDSRLFTLGHCGSSPARRSASPRGGAGVSISLLLFDLN